MSVEYESEEIGYFVSGVMRAMRGLDFIRFRWVLGVESASQWTIGGVQ